MLSQVTCDGIYFVVTLPAKISDNDCKTNNIPDAPEALGQ